MQELFLGKRYHTLDYFFKNKFGTKIAKIPLSGGFTCPNRDGTKGTGGCIYCSGALSGDFAGKAEDSIEKQFSDIADMMSKKWKNTKYMAYFQTGTGTYADIAKLEYLYNAAISQPDVVSLSVATRPDCISKECFSLLEKISKKTYLTVELGLQSVHDTTGRIINRQSTYAEFLQSFTTLKNLGIDVCVHLINGLPFETVDMMNESVRTVSELLPWSLKLHLLHVIRRTECEKMYNRGEFRTFEKDEYVSLVCDQLQMIDKRIVMQRLTGDGKRDELVAPLWSIRKFELLNSIDAEMERRGAIQGDKA
ncbi:MAG: TIGR01212 family radical SAM protein [Clostridia bacterium]|nr:TIGR01212 family radical SAM protein [Clostridia bacterium]